MMFLRGRPALHPVPAVLWLFVTCRAVAGGSVEEVDPNPSESAAGAGAGSGGGGGGGSGSVPAAEVKPEEAADPVKGEAVVVQEGAAAVPEGEQVKVAAPAPTAPAAPAVEAGPQPVTSTLYIGLEINRIQLTGTTVRVWCSLPHLWSLPAAPTMCVESHAT
jgi:hypothetical protein